MSIHAVITNIIGGNWYKKRRPITEHKIDKAFMYSDDGTMALIVEESTIKLVTGLSLTLLPLEFDENDQTTWAIPHS